MNTPTRRTVLGAALAGLALPAVAACSGQTTTTSGSNAQTAGNGGGGDKRITMALTPGWDEGVATTYLWKEILEKKGYSVTVNELEVAQAYVAVAGGQADMYLDSWLPTTHETYWTKYSDKLEKVAGWFNPATNLLAVPTYVNGVDSIADLTGKGSEFGGQIIGIEPGSGLMRLTKEAAIPDYGLSDFTLVESSTSAMLAALDKATAAQQPIVVTLWKPHWAFTKYPMKALQDPQGAYGDADTATIIATKGFAEKQPEVAGWVSKYTVDDSQLGSLELLIQDKGQGNEQAAAAEWISQNQPVVDSWIS